MKRLAALALAASCGFLVSCASTSKADAASAEKKAVAASTPTASGDWELVSLEKNGTKVAIVTATLSVTDKGKGTYSVSGFSGVNNYSGSLTANGNKIAFAPNLASTRMAGPQDAMTFESLYLELLGNADTWNVTDSELTLSGGKAVARFVKKGLDGTSWKLTAANTGNAVVSQQGNITLSFKGGKATGFTGINNVSLGYTADAKTRALSFADGPLTLRAGTENEAKAERLFLDNIFKTASYSLNGNGLTLYDKKGTTLLQFVKAQ